MGTLKAGVDQPLTRKALFRKIAPLVSLLEDGHTTVGLLTEELNDFARNDGLWFPLSLSITESETRVVENYSSESSIVPGTRLVSINGIRMEEMAMDLTRFISSESLSHRMAVVEAYFHFYLWLVYEWEDQYEIAFSPPEAEQTLTRSIAGLTYREIQRQRSESADQRDARSFAFYPDPETKTGVLDVTQFSAQQEFALFLSETFAEIRDQRFDRLIIDLRQNSGGSTNVSNELLRYITDEPVRNFARYDLKVSTQIKEYLKQQAPRWTHWLPLQYFFSQGRLIWGAPEGTTVVMEGEFIEPGDPRLRFSGDVFVLVGPRTFSTAADFAAVVKDFGLGTLVGEETGGLACSFGDTYPFRLPNSRIEVRVSYKYFIRPSGEITEGGIKPDHRVLETATDVASGRDAAMDLARELLGGSDGVP
jgi:hypothetical protein